MRARAGELEAELSSERAEGAGREQALLERAEAAERQAQETATQLGARVAELEETSARAEAERDEAAQRAAAREGEARTAVAERTRIERELGGRVQAAEARAADAAGRLAATERARKESRPGRWPSARSCWGSSGRSWSGGTRRRRRRWRGCSSRCRSGPGR